MSHSAAAAHGHDDHAAAHGSLKSYIIGFVLSLLLTFGSFGLVMHGALSHTVTIIGVVALCVLQLLVQLVYFLHMGASKSARANLAAVVVTVLLIAIIVGGSAWVLYNMNVNMGHAM
ncbi:hypothetical protein G6F59_017366 [Rhizopus arrhizus]|nr:hypothetical protein G6F59_017366 [Rhizopus arrhizus]